LTRILILGVMLGTGAAVGWLHSHAPLDRAQGTDARFVPRPEVARVASLGFRALVADYYWIQAVQVVGAETSDPGRHADLIGRLVDVVTTVDPWVSHPYRFAANWMVRDAKQVRHANRLLERAIEHHPDDWRGYFYLGFNHFFYLNESVLAADRIEQAALLEGAPSYLARLAARLRAGTAGLDTAAAFLSEMAESTQDPQARRQYDAALLEIEAERRARVLDEARERYVKARGRDIEAVEDLVTGFWAVLPGIPPDPYGEGWKLSDEGRIVSVHLGRRYEPWMHENDLKRRKIIEIEQGGAES
jgi:hypothetical protein